MQLKSTLTQHDFVLTINDPFIAHQRLRHPL